MSKKPRVRVIKESETGLNEQFLDVKTNRVMSRREFADAIERGEYPDYHVMRMNNKRIPRSNPDKSKNNNLD